MTTGVSCTVYVDAERAADGSPGDDLANPIILDDLTVTWGRSDTMSQPEPDSCSFQVMDQANGQAFAKTYRVGRQLDILARGNTYPDPSEPTFANPGFETATVTWDATGGTATRQTTRVNTGTHALALAPTTPGTSATVLLAPSELQEPGTNPDAWDHIPTTSIGQTWSTTATLWLPPGASATVRAAVFTGPYAPGAYTAGAPRTVVGNGTWQTVTAEYVVQLDDAWLGVAVTLNPTGPAWDQMAATLTWDAADPTWTWDDLGTLYLDDVQVTSPASGNTRGVLVFSGRITGLSTTWDTSTGSPVVDVTATGFTADLQNRNVGDEPWPVEDANTRAHRILNLAGLPIDIDIDTSVDTILLSWRDVDSQGAFGLLQSIATSVDGVLWPAVHQALGAYLRLEDPSLRVSLLKLAEQAGLIVIVQADPDVGFDLSACAIQRDDVTWVQDVSDVVTRAAATWKVQGVNEEGNPTTTEATETQIDADLERLYGTRRVSVSTELQSAVDASDVASRILQRTNPMDWRASGLTVDDDDVDAGADGVRLMLDLLDGTSRIGAPVVLKDLPVWSPDGAMAGVYLEGGTYRFVGGRWVLDLLMSASEGLGGSAAWDELDPAWTWDQWSPQTTWDDLRGAAAP